MADESEEKKVLCRFVTKLPEAFSVTSGDLAIPASASRYGLSQTVNALLAAAASSGQEGGVEGKRVFDFLVEGELLRGNLNRHLEKRGLSVEKTVEIEYFFAIEPPEPSLDLPQPDWVSAVVAASSGMGTGGEDVVFAGCYDGTVQTLLGTSGASVSSLSAHKDAVSALAVFKISSDEEESQSSSSHKDVSVLVTASKDNSLKGWFVSRGDEAEEELADGLNLTQVFEFVGHTGAIESLAASPGSCRFCSGGWDQVIRIWSTDVEDLTGARMNLKKQKLRAKDDDDGFEQAVGLEQVETASLEGHTQCISSVCWPEENLICSSSWDSTVKCWDVAKGKLVSNLIRESAIFCLDCSRQSAHSGGLNLAFGGTDGHVSVWDPRESLRDNKMASVKLFKSHKSVVADVSWSPSSPFHFASCDYQGLVKVWDVRSAMPLHSLSIHEDKALCLEWFSNKIASGGADCKVSLQTIAVRSEK